MRKIVGFIAGYSVFCSDFSEESSRKRLIVMPEFIENKIGEIGKKILLRVHGSKILHKNSATHECLDSLLELFTEKIESTKNWNLTVIKGSEKNAFVLPDGSIFVFTGLIPFVDNVDELGFILSHEISHVLLRHSSELISIGLVLSIISSLIFFYFGELDISFITDLFLNLPLSRYDETEADLNALKIMAKIGLDLNAGLSLMKKFQSLNQETIEILSTHPLSENRAQYIEQEIKNLNQDPFDSNFRIQVLREKFEIAKEEVINLEQNKKPLSEK